MKDEKNPPAEKTEGKESDKQRQTTKENVARFFASRGVKVRAAKRDKAGKPITLTEGPDKGKFDVVERTVTADDILSFREVDDRVIATTIDGRRYDSADA